VLPGLHTTPAVQALHICQRLQFLSVTTSAVVGHQGQGHSTRPCAHAPGALQRTCSAASTRNHPPTGCHKPASMYVWRDGVWAGVEGVAKHREGVGGCDGVG
jgi:hypothetical protein